MCPAFPHGLFFRYYKQLYLRNNYWKKRHNILSTSDWNLQKCGIVHCCFLHLIRGIVPFFFFSVQNSPRAHTICCIGMWYEDNDIYVHLYFEIRNMITGKIGPIRYISTGLQRLRISWKILKGNIITAWFVCCMCCIQFQL